MIKNLKEIAAGLALSLLVVAGVVVATTVPAAATGACGPGVETPCGIVEAKPNCSIHLKFYNPGSEEILRSIAVFRDGQEVFGDDAFIGHGFTPTLIFGPLADGEWRFLVTSGSTVMADETFTCGV